MTFLDHLSFWVNTKAFESPDVFNLPEGFSFHRKVGGHLKLFRRLKVDKVKKMRNRILKRELN